MKRLIKIFTAMIFAVNLALPAFSTEIPKPITDLIIKNFPKANIRFDGLIELPDGTQYLPVIPINIANVNDPAAIVKTIPAKATISSKPDLMLFANNFSLLKIIKKQDEPPTLVSSNDIPLTIKLGILPQDLVVPENFVIPYDLKIIMGDLKIPVKENNYQGLNFERKAGKLIGKVNKKVVAPELNGLTNKLFYVSNFRSNIVKIINPQTGRAQKNIELSSIPYDLQNTNDGRYILASCVSTNKVSIIDTYNSSYIRDIGVGDFPTSIVVTQNIAYVANRNSSSISVINLRTMEVIKTISVTGNPTNLTISQDNNSLYYNDLVTGNIYEVDLNNIDMISSITQADSISKISQNEDNLYILSRADNTLTVYNLTDGKQVKKLSAGNKPVDIKVFQDKIYVLSAGDNTLTIINKNTLEVVKTVTLKNGFPSGILMLPKLMKALIFNQNSNEITVFDLNNNQIIGSLPVITPISLMIVSEINK